jgi:hypothetical protein
MSLSITGFDFHEAPADPDALIRAWMPEIEQAAHQYVPDDKFIAFWVAALRLGARSKSLEGLNLMRLVEVACSQIRFLKDVEDCKCFPRRRIGAATSRTGLQVSI